MTRSANWFALDHLRLSHFLAGLRLVVQNLAQFAIGHAIFLLLPISSRFAVGHVRECRSCVTPYSIQIGGHVFFRTQTLVSWEYVPRVATSTCVVSTILHHSGQFVPFRKMKSRFTYFLLRFGITCYALGGKYYCSRHCGCCCGYFTRDR